MAKKEKFVDLSLDELKAQEQDFRKEIFKLVNEVSMSKKSEKPHLLRNLKKDRARLLTMISAKEGGI